MIWLDIVMLIVAIAAIVRGMKTGIVMQLASLTGIILGAIFAGKVAEWLYPHLNNFISNSEHMTGPLSYVLGFVLILIAVNLLGKIVDRFVKIVFLGTINRVLGAAFCLGKWIVILSILLNLVVEYDNNKTIIKEQVRTESKAYDPMIEIAQIIVPYLRFNKQESTTPFDVISL